jgi:plastocyanin
VTQPGSSTVTVTTPNETFSPATVNLAAGGTVVWQISGATHNVTFAGTAPAGGNIPDTSPGNSASRTFATAGTYNYQCTRHSGMSGIVVVGAAGGAPTPTPPPPPASDDDESDD